MFRALLIFHLYCINIGWKLKRTYTTLTANWNGRLFLEAFGIGLQENWFQAFSAASSFFSFDPSLFLMKRHFFFSFIHFHEYKSNFFQWIMYAELSWKNVFILKEIVERCTGKLTLITWCNDTLNFFLFKVYFCYTGCNWASPTTSQGWFFDWKLTSNLLKPLVFEIFFYRSRTIKWSHSKHFLSYVFKGFHAYFWSHRITPASLSTTHLVYLFSLFWLFVILWDEFI